MKDIFTRGRFYYRFSCYLYTYYFHQFQSSRNFSPSLETANMQSSENVIFIHCGNKNFRELHIQWCAIEILRYANAKNLGSVGQRAAKLLAVKVGGLRKVCQPAPAPVSQCARVRTPAPSNHSQSLMAGNFAAL